MMPFPDDLVSVTVEPEYLMLKEQKFCSSANWNLVSLVVIRPFGIVTEIFEEPDEG